MSDLNGMLDFAYLAGVIDSDGYIRIHRATKRQTTPAGTEFTGTYYSAQVGIAGTRSAPHELARSLFGGSIRKYQPKNPRHRAQFQWTVWGDGAVRVLTAVRPFLRIKGEQADLASELQRLVADQFAQIKATTRPPYRIPKPMVAARQVLFDRVTELNQSRRAPRTWGEYPDQTTRLELT